MCVKPNKGQNRNLDTSSFLFSSTSPLHPHPPFILVMQSGYIIFFTAICDLWVNEENVKIYIYIYIYIYLYLHIYIYIFINIIYIYIFILYI